jgi:DNA replication factor GINS
MMDLDELQSVRDRERQTDRLQQLRDSFYADAGEFIQQLRRERARAADHADDPFDAPAVSRLSDEIDTAEQTVEAIFEKRIGKIVKAASLAAADLPTESAGMTAEEQALFESLVADIEGARERVLDTLAGERTTRDDGDETSASAAASDAEPDAAADSSPASATPSSGQESASTVSAADVMGGEELSSGRSDEPAETTDRVSEGRDDGAGGDGTERVGEPEPSVSDGGATVGIGRTTVRITDDVGPIFGVDEREYDLAAADVVTLPTDNAEPLIERDVAEQLE